MSTSTHEGYEDLELSVGERLRRVRERRTGLDQEQFAAAIYVSRGTVSHYERDMIPNSPRRRLVLNAWAQATGVTVEWLETGVGSSAGPDDHPDGGLPVADRGNELARLTASKSSRSASKGHNHQYVDAA